VAESNPPFPMRGERLAVELANTVFATGGEPADGLTSPELLAAWLRVHDEQLRGAERAWSLPQSVPSVEHLEQLHVLRAAIRNLFAAVLAGGRRPAAAVEQLNAVSASAPTFGKLRWPASGNPAETIESTAVDPFAVALAAVARDAIALLGGPDRERLRSCPAPGCVLYFVKDHPRRAWCSDSCGNRARVARHYRRHRGPATPDR
jgi:predicted RNA-binding Zn ribbon-like protein